MAATLTTPSTSLPADRFYRTALFFLVLTSVITLVGTGKLDLFTTIAAPALVLYKGIRWWRGNPPELRHATATRLVVAYIFFFPADFFFISRALAGDAPNPGLYAGLLAVVHFLLFVTLVRFYSIANDRDALFLSMLSFAGVLASAIFTVDTSFLAFFVLFLIFAVAVFVGLEIRRGAKGTVFPPMDVDTSRERRFHRALATVAISVSVGAVLIGTVLFFSFPRFNAGYFARTGLQPSLMTGFTDNVELGQIGEIKKNTMLVMRVQTGRPVNYPLLRWRGIALTNFDGHRWYTPEIKTRPKSPDPNGWIFVSSQRVLESRPAMQLQFVTLLQPSASAALFGPAQVMALRGNFSGEGGAYETTMRRGYLSVDAAGSIYNPFHNYSQIRYEGMSVLPVVRPTQARFAGSEYPKEIREANLQLPAHIDERIPELARNISANATNPYDKSLAIEKYLQTNFSYTLNLSGNPGRDPLAHFLFETKAGHCEYFATAMAVMLRTLGIPSREVNGFLPGEYNDLGGDYIVRASDAHSWVEAYFPGTGWLTFDPTPPSNEPAAGLLSRMEMYLDLFQLSWNEWVINYDFSHQVNLARNVGQISTDWKERWQRKIDHAQNAGMERLADWQRSHDLLRFAVPILLVASLAFFRMNWMRSLVRWVRLAWLANLPESERNSPQMASRLYAELLRLLRKRGFARLDTQTAGEFALSFDAHKEFAPAVQEFTNLYVQSRFGGLPCDAFRLRMLLEQIRTTPRPT